MDIGSLKSGTSLFQRRLATKISEILFIAVLLGLYSLSREVTANTAPEEKSNDNAVVGERFFSLFSLHTSKHANYSHASTVSICSC